MSEQQYAELGKTLGILVERVEGLSQCVDDLRQHVNTCLDDMCQHFDRRIDDTQKLSTWVRGLLVGHPAREKAQGIGETDAQHRNPGHMA